MMSKLHIFSVLTILPFFGALYSMNQADLDKKLFDAVLAKDKSEIVKLLNQGANIQAKDFQGETPLHYAIYSNPETIALLIRNGAVVDARNDNGETPLHFAAETYNRTGAIIKLLLDNGADVNARDKNNTTPLHKAVLEGSPVNFNELFTRGADVNAVNIYGETPLHKAAYQGYNHLIEDLVSAGANVNAQDLKGETPLFKAAAKAKKRETVKLLLSKGADSTIKDFNGNELIDLAAAEIVTILKNYEFKQLGQLANALATLS